MLEKRTLWLVAVILATALGGSTALATTEPGPAARLDLGQIQQVGEVVHQAMELPDAGPSEEHAGGKLFWSYRIEHSGASYICPHFSRFSLPEGAYLVIRSEDYSRVWVYDRFGKEDLGVSKGFWGIHIPGETAILELYSPEQLPKGAVSVDRFARGYSAEEMGILYDEALCGADDSEWARCYRYSEPTIYDESRAVARLIINGTGACTGWLIGDQGHVMTNEHCIGSGTDAANTNFEFMAEGATCTTGCAFWGACPGTVVATRSTLVQLDADLDYSLVRLPTNPTGTYGYLQLRSTLPVVNERIYIPQHPQAWGKRIAVFSTHSTDASGYCEIYSTNRPPCAGGPGDIGYYADTQGGSSGSPVLAYSDHLVVALHHCAYCPNRGVPIPSIITDLGANLPRNALCGGHGQLACPNGCNAPFQECGDGRCWYCCGDGSSNGICGTYADGLPCSAIPGTNRSDVDCVCGDHGEPACPDGCFSGFQECGDGNCWYCCGDGSINGICGIAWDGTPCSGDPASSKYDADCP